MLITNFASGELSQNLNGRVDLPQYYRGAARIENFDIIPTGGIKRRVGTQRVAQLGDNSRIIPFIVDKNATYILEICPNPNYDSQTPSSTQGLIKVWKKNVSQAYEVIATIGSPWANLAEIREVQYAQNFDTMIFAHRDYPPFILVMKTSTTFEGSEMQFDFSPDVQMDDDFEYIMIPISGTGFPTKLSTADGHGRFEYHKEVAGVDTVVTKDFEAHVKDFYCVKDGKLWKWDETAGVSGEFVVYGSDPKIDDKLFRQSNKYPSCVAYFNNRLFFASTGEKPQMVWGSAAPDSYDNRYNQFSTYKKYVTVNKVTKDADLHVFSADLAFANIDTVNHTCTFTNVTQNFTAEGALKNALTDYFISCDYLPIGTKVISATSNTITVNSDKFSYEWEEGETTAENLVMSIQLWKRTDSATADDFEYAVVATNVTTADCALFFELASDQNDSIKFLSSNKFLAIGTESSIWSVDGGINALNISAAMQGRYGSDELQGQAVETATVYFAQGKKGIREFYYNTDSAVNAFQSNNLALVADHVLRESAAVDFDYMTNPYSRLMVVRADGICVTMLYDKTNGITAWSRIVLGKGLIRNCAITRGEDENDLIFFVVEENNNYYLEVLDMGNEIYLDSRRLFDNSTTGYTEGAILFNQSTGKTCPYDDIPENFIGENDIVYIGYRYRSYIKSMPVVNNDVSGRRRITALQVRFLNSYMPVMKCTGMSDERFTTVKQIPYSGIGKITYPGSTDYDVTFELEAEEPRPVNILSVDALTA